MIAKSAAVDDLTPAICMEKGCSYVVRMEPAIDGGWCPVCEKTSMKSGGLLIGLYDDELTITSTGDSHADRSRSKYVTVSDGKQEYEICLYYDVGGMNFLLGKTEQRGYWLTVTPIHRSDGWKRTVAFSGNKLLIQEAKRYSKKIFTGLVHEILENPGIDRRVRLLLDHVVKKHRKRKVGKYG
jgi:hypothetical protein